MSVVERVDGAPHGRVVYGFVVLIGVAGGLFFGAASLTTVTDAAMGWRVAFALPTLLFFGGVALGLERLLLPERAQRRSIGWTVAVRERLVWGRWIALLVAFCGAGGLTVLRHLVPEADRDVCDDLRVLCWTLLFLGFFLADLVGERTFELTATRERWGSRASGASRNAPRRSRRRRTGLTVQDGS